MEFNLLMNLKKTWKLLTHIKIKLNALNYKNSKREAQIEIWLLLIYEYITKLITVTRWPCFFSVITCLYEFSQQTAPLIPKDVGPSEAAVSAAHTQVGDAFINQVKGGGQAALASCEGFASGTAYHSPTLQKDTF